MCFGKNQDGICEQAISSAILSAGYEPNRILQHEHRFEDMDEIFSLIRESRFIVADLTNNREDVYYKVGFAKGLNIPIIFTCRKDVFYNKNIHFDVRHYNFLLWEEGNYQVFQKLLKNKILEIIKNGDHLLLKH